MRPRSTRVTLIFACLSVALSAVADLAVADDGHTLTSVPQAFATLGGHGKTLVFDRGRMQLPRGGHLQGIQTRYDADRQRQLVILSHDSLTTGYLAIVTFANLNAAESPSGGTLRHVHPLPTDGQSPPLRHAGGFQLSGTIAAIGVEDNQEKKRSQVQFWETADPEQLVQLAHLTIERSSEIAKQATAGAVGILEREKDFLVAVGNWDCQAIDFYASSGKSLAAPECRFKHVLQWQAAAASTDDWRPDANRGAYQAINLLSDAGGGFFLLGFDTPAAGRDNIDLFELDLTRGPKRALRKLARKQIRLAGDNHFRFAGGVSVQEGTLTILSSERNFKAQEPTLLNIVK